MRLRRTTKDENGRRAFVLMDAARARLCKNPRRTSGRLEVEILCDGLDPV